MNLRLLLLAAGLVLGAFLAVGLTRRGDGEPGGSARRDPPGTVLESKSSVVPERGSRGTRSQTAERRVQGLSLKEVLARLPEEPDATFSDRSLPENQETIALLRRLGTLLGGDAIDVLIERYGDSGFTIYAIGPALAGWAASDPAAASAALLALDANTEDQVQAHSRTLVTWKGHNLFIDGDFSPFVVRVSLAEALGALAEVDSATALRTLQQFQSPDTFQLGAYLNGLDASTDWLAAREELLALEPVGGEAAVTTVTARAWSRHEFDEALDWFLGVQEGSERSLYGRARPILVDFENRSEAIDWMEVHVRSGEVSDEEVVNFAGYLRGNSTGATLEQVVALPRESSRRHEIVESWVSPRRVRDEVHPWYPPDVLRDLIAAARLSPTESAALGEIVERNAHLPPVFPGN